MTNVWGFKPLPEFQSKCDRCGQVECICGDAAFEAWVEAELNAQSYTSSLSDSDADYRDRD